jgi:hypothetical protein
VVAGRYAGWLDVSVENMFVIAVFGFLGSVALPLPPYPLYKALPAALRVPPYLKKGSFVVSCLRRNLTAVQFVLKNF